MLADRRPHLTVLVTVGLLAAAPVEPGPVAASTGSEVTDLVAACDDLDASRCLLPFPSDAFTVADATTATGRRVALDPLAMPRNVAGKPIDPTEWNRNDGFSPGSMLLTHVPALDLEGSFGIDRPQLERPGLSLAPDAPIVVVNAETGARHPYVAELDRHPDTSDDERLLIVRPLESFEEGTRYVVGLRGLVDTAGGAIPAGDTFAALRDGSASGDRAAHFEGAVFPVLEAAGVDREDLYLAWDFTVASERSLAGRALHIRDDAFAQLDDPDLADLRIAGAAPAFAITSVEPVGDPLAWRRVTGTVTVPNYLQLPQDEGRTPGLDDPTDQLEDLPPLMVLGSRFLYDTPTPGPSDLPIQNPAVPTLEASFVCTIPEPQVGRPLRPMLYGHGLLGGKSESRGGSTHAMRERGYMPCGVDWIGMAFEDIPNVATILADMSNFPSLADRAQQGFLNYLLVGRALAHPDGLASDPAFQTALGDPVFDPGRLVYDGNSQGGIMGGALTALAVDFTRATLGVPGMNYSTLLNRSVDWEGEFSEVAYLTYPDKIDQQLVFALIQMLWDRAEANGYAQHMTDDPHPNTPAHQVLLHVAFGDYQVANLAAEVEGRTIGARRIGTDLLAGRHWADDPMFGFEPLHGAHAGSALVYFDSGNPTPPSSNVPPEHRGADPHEHPRRDPFGADQKDHFYRTGVVRDVHHGEPYWTYACPVHPEEDPGCGG